MKINNTTTLLILILAIVALVLLVIINAKPKYIKIDSEEAKEIIVNEGNFKIIDTRSKSDYDDGHIKDSILIPKDKIEEKILKEIKDKNTLIIVYGKTNSDSKEVAKMLLEIGYKYVYDLGDIENWKYNLEE